MRRATIVISFVAIATVEWGALWYLIQEHHQLVAALIVASALTTPRLPLWGSTLSLQDRTRLSIGAFFGAFAGAMPVALVSIATLDPNLGALKQSPHAAQWYFAAIVAAVIGSLVGCYSQAADLPALARPSRTAVLGGPPNNALHLTAGDGKLDAGRR